MPAFKRCFWPPWLALVVLLSAVAAQKLPPKTPWPTLTGEEPAVIARGGMSGLFPDSSQTAYSFTQLFSRPNTVLWCDLQLTKDEVGICLPTVKMDNSTDIVDIFPDGKKDYLLNGVPVSGWFTIDYEFEELSNVSLIQGIYSRTNKFDGQLGILSVDDIHENFKSPLWLNFQYTTFYSQHNISMRSYLLELTRRVVINYVSSPEVSFLTSIQARVAQRSTHLVFRFMDSDVIEPSTNQSYGSLAKNMTFIRTFASGIIMPKSYIWPVDSSLYLLPHTSIVSDAHKAGLQVFAADFANDFLIAYNYSYDPISEYISFVDNGAFSVDGIVTDSPVTASSAIGCFAHVENSSTAASLTVISHNGASGVYPGCTDLAYHQAIADGADYIDCPVQVTKDGVLICMTSPDLFSGTTVAKSAYAASESIIPEIQPSAGVFTFNLTWEDIQKNLKPEISAPQQKYLIYRNPLYQNAGNFVTLSDFLSLATNSSLAGVVITIENAAFSNKNLGFNLVEGIQAAVEQSGLTNQTGMEVMIMSTESAVLKAIGAKNSFKLTYMIDESISGADNSSIADIAGFAHAVAVGKQSIYPVSTAFIVGKTDVVGRFQAANLSVYAYLFLNEFTSQPWDFFSDPTVEINSYFQAAGVNGIITDFPQTAVAYKRNPCLALGKETPRYMLPVLPGELVTLVQPPSLPPALPPSPVLDDADVIEPPLPPTSRNATLSPLGAGQPPVQSPVASSHPGPTRLPLLFSLLALIVGASLS
ncbi:glycerophosphodiester phosphodiesterase GDPDL3-like [Wolffia australiana]